MSTLTRNPTRPRPSPRRLGAFSSSSHFLVRFQLAAILAASAAFYVSRLVPGEPFFNNDETRHVMTGVFVHDLICDHPTSDVEGYALRYYAQYPALGLLIWPPLFYLIEGGAMLLLGTSLWTAKLTVIAMATIALTYLYLLARDAFGRQVAALATLLFAVCPIIVTYATQVMLELPFMAFALAALFHITRYLEHDRRRHLWWGGAAICAAALTRYDAIILLPCLALLLLLRRQPRWILRREVLTAILVSTAVLLPYYLAFANIIGFVQFDAALQGKADDPLLISSANLLFYPACLPSQVSWFVVIPALLGICLEVRNHGCRRSAPFLALIAASYLTLTPLAEDNIRHGIHWVPAFAAFAAIGVMSLRPLIERPNLRFAAVTLMLLGTLCVTERRSVGHVRGYQDAARYVIEHSDGTPTCLIDSYLDGNFTYQLRALDSARRFWVLRGDKLFYSTVSTPGDAYTEWVSSEDEILDLIHYYDPQYIVVEHPRILGAMPMAAALRNLLRTNRDHFALEREIPIDTNRPQLRTTLLVYRNKIRNADQPKQLEINMLWPKCKIIVDLPPTLSKVARAP